MNKTKLWKVEREGLCEIEAGGLDYEERIHHWIEHDLSIILPNATLIGSKVKTDHGKELDLLAIDENGDLIVLELKKGLSSREVTAQVLDYTAWVSTLSETDIDEILQKHGDKRTISEILSEKYDNGDDLDINENQKIYIVASEIDAITERICKYLASNGVQINVATFNYFRDGDQELIARNVLISEMESPKDTPKKRSGRFVTRLFNEGKLEIGQKVRYLPAEKNGTPIHAEVIRKGSKCLKIPGSEEVFSFTGLRRKVIQEQDLGLNAHYPYAQWAEWEHVEKATLLSEL